MKLIANGWYDINTFLRGRLMQTIVTTLREFLWGPVMLLLLLGTGLYLSIKTNFLCFVNLPKALKSFFSKESLNEQGDGDVSPFASLCAELAATIGTGNIAGVASALLVGGPGAIVWMWLSAALGLTTKYAECMLAFKYRITNDKNEKLGGPMLTMELGLKEKYGDKGRRCGKVMAMSFAIFTMLATLGVGALTQGNSICIATDTFFDGPSSNVLVGIILAVLSFVIISYGIKGISRVSMVIVPIMAIIYFLGSLGIVISNYQNIPLVLKDIFTLAFSFKAISGGLTGSFVYSFSRALSNGLARGCFSNEAGMGSSAIGAAASVGDNPVQVGYNFETSVFWDTFVVCSATAFAILTSGALAYSSGLDKEIEGVDLVRYAFSSSYGSFGAAFVAFAIILFAFSTIVSWEFHGEKALEYLSDSKKAIKAYRFLYATIVFVGCISTASMAWEVTDIFNALMIIPNTLSLLLLSDVIRKEVLEYQKRK